MKTAARAARGAARRQCEHVASRFSNATLIGVLLNAWFTIGTVYVGQQTGVRGDVAQCWQCNGTAMCYWQHVGVALALPEQRNVLRFIITRSG